MTSDEKAVRPEGRAAPVLRFIRHPLVLLVLGVGLVGVPAIILASVGPNVIAARAPALLFPFTVLSVAVTWCGYRLFKRWIEGAPDRELPFEAGWARELSSGLGLGFLVFSSVVGAVALMGGLTVTGIGTGSGFWAIAALALAAGVNEEVLFRAIGFRFIEQLGGSLAALALTSLVFGLSHLANPGATLFAAIAIASEAGILLGGAYMLTRRLWLAVGIHTAWNFTQGFVWSIAVSGNAAADGIFRTQSRGPHWLTGGAFGLEASAVTMVIVTVIGVGMVLLAARRGHWVPVGWRPERG